MMIIMTMRRGDDGDRGEGVVLLMLLLFVLLLFVVVLMTMAMIILIIKFPLKKNTHIDKNNYSTSKMINMV